MQYEFDATKSVANFAKHGVSMRDSDDFDWETADIWQDKRCAYPEPRFVALGLIEDQCSCDGVLLQRREETNHQPEESK
jgi:uncharacterized protein